MGGTSRRRTLPLSQVEIGFADHSGRALYSHWEGLVVQAKTSDWCQGDMVILPAVSSVVLLT